MSSWNEYYNSLKPLAEQGKIELPFIPKECKHNAHMFYFKAKDLEERTKLLSFLKTKGVLAVFHYIPLHSAPAGIKLGEFRGEDKYTTKESERLVRLPMYYGLDKNDIDCVIRAVNEFYN